jgi:hypothetical protein
VTANRCRAAEDELVGVQARRPLQLAQFELMVAPPAAAVLMAVVPVAIMTVTPIISRPSSVVSCVMPFPFVPVAVFPRSTLPITMPVIVPVTVPARTNDNSTRDTDVHSNVDVWEGD